jgi:hypothetical protein
MTWDDARKAISDKNAEIERLKGELAREKATSDKFLKDLQDQTRLAGKYMAKLFTAQDFITELCDAMIDSGCTKEQLDLIQRAREAAK